MVWVSVDGLEGAGKSTLVRCLVKRFSGAHVLPEFSAGFAGRAIAAAVKRNPHYISRSPVAQSLFFMGEYIEKIDRARALIDDDRKLILSDRGLLSKLAYQSAVLRPVIGTQRTRALLATCLQGLPLPDMTIWLTIEPDVAGMRIKRRGAARSERDLKFMEVAAREFERFAKKHNAVRVDSSVMNPSQLCDSVHSKIVTEWPRLWKNLC